MRPKPSQAQSELGQAKFGPTQENMCSLCLGVMCVVVQIFVGVAGRSSAGPLLPSAQFFAVFPSPAKIFILSSLSWGSSRGIVSAVQGRIPEVPGCRDHWRAVLPATSSPCQGPDDTVFDEDAFLCRMLSCVNTLRSVLCLIVGDGIRWCSEQHRPSVHVLPLTHHERPIPAPHVLPV